MVTRQQRQRTAQLADLLLLGADEAVVLLEMLVQAAREGVEQLLKEHDAVLHLLHALVQRLARYIPAIHRARAVCAALVVAFSSCVLELAAKFCSHVFMCQAQWRGVVNMEGYGGDGVVEGGCGGGCIWGVLFGVSGNFTG